VVINILDKTTDNEFADVLDQRIFKWTNKTSLHKYLFLSEWRKKVVQELAKSKILHKTSVRRLIIFFSRSVSQQISNLIAT
jgi:hypothetical protein